MRRSLPLAVLLVLGAAAPARGQAFPAQDWFWEITGSAGYFVPEEPETAEIEGEPLFGLRVGARQSAGFGIEAHGAYTPLEMQVEGSPGEVVDLGTFLYGVEGLYSWPISPRTDFFVAAGLGGITWSPDREGTGEELESETDVRASFGAGAHVLVTDGFALRADLRDHLVFDQLSETARALRIVDKGNSNNLELSVGAAFLIP